MKTLDLICDFCGESVQSLFCSGLDNEVSCYDCFIAKRLSEIKRKKDLTNGPMSANTQDVVYD